MIASVLLVGRYGATRWHGSGVLIARADNQFAILTNRHIVETDDQRLCAVTAMTVTGEVAIARTVWRARRGYSGPNFARSSCVRFLPKKTQPKTTPSAKTTATAITIVIVSILTSFLLQNFQLRQFAN
jgi:hypothetical protein